WAIKTNFLGYWRELVNFNFEAPKSTLGSVFEVESLNVRSKIVSICGLF
ncbi:unnamed protein product, partial [Amoebophrya sp. A25]